MPEDTTTETPAVTDTTASTTDDTGLDTLTQAPETSSDTSEPDKDDELKGNTPLARANREAANLRAKLKKLEPIAQRVKELEPLAEKARAIEEAQKTEVERLNERLAAAQNEVQHHRVVAIRLAAAIEAGLDPTMAEFITAADEDTALEQAKKLAKHLTPPAPPAADFRQGVRTTPPPKQDGNQILRRLAGHPQ